MVNKQAQIAINSSESYNIYYLVSEQYDQDQNQANAQIWALKRNDEDQ